MTSLIHEYIEIFIGNLLSESKQNIVNLGYPPVVASIFFENFGPKAFLLAKWLKDYSNYRNLDNSIWFGKSNIGNMFSGRRNFNLHDILFMYEAAASGDIERYQAARKENDFALENEIDLDDAVRLWKSEVKESVLEDPFFNSVFIKDIISGKISDLKPFSKLTYQEAQDKYDKKRVFKEAEPLKTYPNGWKWINVGPKCQLVGGQMKNCGSTGVMSSDPDRSMITLFDPRNKPHVVVTWSPNDKRISGDEGVGSTPVKDIYQDYVFDLAKTLGANFDFERTKSPIMKIKGAVGPENVKSITSAGGTSHYSKVELINGETWFTNGYYFAPESDVIKMMPEYENDLLKTLIGVFHHDFRNLRSRVGFVSSFEFARRGLPG